MRDQHEKFMLKALNLAAKGIGQVEPNPAVGCVIIKGNQVAGKGWHKKFGGPHAEIVAIEDCGNLGIKPGGSTMYVTLEPCSHHGKTGPCTEAIIEAAPARVVIATEDPSGHAKGKGIEILRNAGIEVVTDVCKIQARLLNAPFMKFAGRKKTWVTLKWAQTIDGKLAFAGQGDGQRWISSQTSRQDVHALRRRAGAILVGINTVLTDDPLLTPRPARGKKPLRIVLDSQLKIPIDCKLIVTAKKFPLLIYSWDKAVRADSAKVKKLNDLGAEVLSYADTGGCSNLHFLMENLSERGIVQLLVEGGPKVLASFMKEKLADELCVYMAPKILGASGAADIAKPLQDLSESLELKHVGINKFEDDVCIKGFTASAMEGIGLGSKQ